MNIDIRDREGLLRHAGRLKGKVNTVVHMATLRHGARKKDLFDTILKGTLNLYELANEIGCRKFINFSSILAAGWTPRDMDRLDETYAPDASRLCYYGKMKLETEMRLAKLSSDNMTKVVTLRPGNIYGPPKLSFIRFIADMIKRRDKVFYQRAKESIMWAPIHTQDVLDCVFMLAGRERFDNGLYFLTGDEPATLEELTAIVSDQIGAGTGITGELGVMEKLQLAIRRIPDRLREIAGMPSFPDFVYSNQNIKNNLGFYPRRRLKEGIAETIAWAKGKGIL